MEPYGSFDPTQETLNPYAAPQGGGGFLDTLRQALTSGAGMAQDVWNYQPFQSTPETRSINTLNPYQAPSPVEQQRDPFLDMLYPSLVKAGSPIAHFMVDPRSEQAATGHYPPALTGQERLKAVADLVGQVTPFEGAAVGVPGVLRSLMSPDPSVGAGSVEGMLGLTPTGKVRVPKVPPVSSDLRLTQLFEYGRKLGGNKWYHNFADTIMREKGAEADLYAGVVAALSPLRPAGALTKQGYALHEAGELADEIPDFAIHMGSNLMLAEKVWDAFKRGGVEEVERVLGPMTQTVRGKKVPSELAKNLPEGVEGIGVMEGIRKNVLAVLAGGKVGGDEARKIQNFRKALMGDKEAVVLDTWMKRVFYPSEKKLNPKTASLEEVAQSEVFTAAQYEATEQIIKDFAKANNSTPADVQAALWVAQKYIDEGADVAVLGSMPFVKSYEYVGRWLKQKGFGPSTAKTMALAGVILGTGMLADEGETEAPLVTSAGRPMLTQ